MIVGISNHCKYVITTFTSIASFVVLSSPTSQLTFKSILCYFFTYKNVKLRLTIDNVTRYYTFYEAISDVEFRIQNECSFLRQ